MMKLRFESNLDFQLQAMDAICDLFRGQEIFWSEFTVAQEKLTFMDNDTGVGNRLSLLGDEILANLNGIQLRNDLQPSAFLDSGKFTVQMEIGTGKHPCSLSRSFRGSLKASGMAVYGRFHVNRAGSGSVGIWRRPDRCLPMSLAKTWFAAQ